MRTIKYTLIILLCCCYSFVKGQQPILLTESDQDYLIKHQDLNIFIDSTDNLTFGDIVTTRYKSQFRKLKDDELSIKSTTSASWIHFAIDRTSLSQSTFLELPDWKIRYADIYIQQADGTFDAIYTGSYRPNSSKVINHKNYVVELPKTNGIIECYIRMKSDMASPFLIKLKSSNYLLSYALSEYLILGIFYGLLFMIGVYNLLLYIGVRDRIYFYYFFYVLSCIAVSTSEDGFGFQYVWSAYPSMNFWVEQLTPYLFMICFLVYASSLLELRTRQPKFLKVIFGISIICAINGLSSINSFPVQSIQSVYSIPFIFIFIAGGISIKNGFKPAKLFMIGMSFTMVAITIIVLRRNEFFNWNELSPLQSLLIVYALNIALLIEIILLSLAQANKIRGVQKRQEASIRKSEQTFRNIFNGSFDALLVVNPQTKKIIDINEKAIHMFQIDKEPFKNIDINKIIELTGDQRKTKHTLSELLLWFEGSDRRSYFKARGINASGAYIPCELTMSALKDLEQPLMVIAMKDITQQKEAEHKLEANIKAITQKNIELKQYIDSNSELESFAYTASHDMKQPIRSIKSFSQLLQKHLDKKGVNDSSSQEFLNFIIGGASNLDQLIHDLLEHSKVSSNKAITFQNTSFDDILLRVKLNLNQQIQENEVQLTHSNLPTIPVESTRLSQLFQNLISNAIKFRKKDTRCSIQITAKETDDFFTFAIKDNSIGIPEEQKEKVFNIFTKLHTAQDYSGSGIGLATCKKIIEQHGGDIWLESEMGVGTTFFFTIKKELDKIRQKQIELEIYN